MAHRNTSTKRCVICAYQTHKKCMSKRMREESEQAGINNELRRKIEQAQEDMKLTRELEDY